MTIRNGLKAVRDALKTDPDLLPVFIEGELLTIQRTVNDKNVLMFVEAEAPCSLTPHKMILRANLKLIGVSSYADGRVARLKGALDRLTAERARILEIAINHGVTEIVDLLTVPREGTEDAIVERGTFESKA